MRDLAGRMQGERAPRNPAAKLEDAPRAKRVSAGDSGAGTYSAMKVYLLRVATLAARAGKFELGWKSARGTCDARHIEESTPAFAEMAVPGTEFEGAWKEDSRQDRIRLFQASNRYAAGQLARHKRYAEWAGLGKLAAAVAALEKHVEETAGSDSACMLSIGWGGGLHSKVAYLETDDAAFRGVLREFPFFQRVMQTGLPFPKTRKIVFEGGEPSTLAGWVRLEVA